VPRGRSRRNKNGAEAEAPKPLNVAQKLMEGLQTPAIPSLDIPETEPMLVAQTSKPPVLH
jgi:hypothetical protein